MENLKIVEWSGDSKALIKGFPDDIKADLGADLYRLQCSKSPKNWKPFPGLKRNAFELRAKDKDGIYRAIFVTFIKEKINVLHCFQKKTQKTSKKDVNIAAVRLKELLAKERNKV